MKKLMFICSLMLSLCACSPGGSGGSATDAGKSVEHSEIEKCLQGLSPIQNLEEAVEAGYRIKACSYTEDQVAEVVR